MISFAQRTLNGFVSLSGCLFHNWVYNLVYNFSIMSRICNSLSDHSNPLEPLFTMIFLFKCSLCREFSSLVHWTFDSPYGLNEFPRCWTPSNLCFWQPAEVLKLPLSFFVMLLKMFFRGETLEWLVETIKF